MLCTKPFCHNPRTHLEELKEAYLVRTTDNCIVNHNQVTMGMVRPPANCSVCADVTQVPHVHDLTREYFLEHHAYTGMLGGGLSQIDWTGLKREDNFLKFSVKRLSSYQCVKMVFQKDWTVGHALVGWA